VFLSKKMTGMLHIESRIEDYSAMLRFTVKEWGEKEPDMFLVSSDGFKVYTQRILLCFYSKFVSDILSLSAGSGTMAGISVSASSQSLIMLIKVLATGSVLSNSREDLLEVGQAAEALGIVMNERQIGVRKNKAGEQDVNQMNVGVCSRGKMVKDFDYRGEDFVDCSDILEIKLSECDDHLAKYKRKYIGQRRNRRGGSKTKRMKSLSCDECGKRFSSKTGFKNHMLLHTGDICYKCEFCPYTNVQKGNVKAHKLKHHIAMDNCDDNKNAAGTSAMENIDAMKSEIGVIVEDVLPT